MRIEKSPQLRHPRTRLKLFHKVKERLPDKDLQNNKGGAAQYAPKTHCRITDMYNPMTIRIEW
jgi:hypothetical protein